MKNYRIFSPQILQIRVFGPKNGYLRLFVLRFFVIVNLCVKARVITENDISLQFEKPIHPN